MRLTVLITFILFAFSAFGQVKETILSFGIDYRDSPTDIENIRPGPIPRPKGIPDGHRNFWKALSLHGQFGYKLKKSWILSASLYGRYNFFHRIENINYSTDPSNPTAAYPTNRPKSINSFKYDLFLDIEKKIRLKKNKERYFLLQAGVGLTNINSKFDVTLTDSLDHRTDGPKRYYGTYLHFGPRLNIGYQYNKIKLYLISFLIEDPLLTNLTSLWIGGGISYEMILKKRKSRAAK